ncbi:MAG: hypothetical protein ACYTXA_24670 [Nostoc sp.]
MSTPLSRKDSIIIAILNMQNKLKLIEINPNPLLSPINLQSISIFLGIIVSISVIATLFFKIVRKFNEIELGLKDVKDNLKSHSDGEGHEKVMEQFKILEKEIFSLDKRFDIHSQNYINRQEVVQMLLTQLNEKVDHKSQRWQGELKDVQTETKQLQKYLQKKEGFRVREDE